ncbi:LVIVD repeat-containing protein [Ketobacter sp.]|uniref:LVIVD repeat-containing protein n=1 Tax=Ketobacter sp. TaxID=2083498 RepID=UPI000F18D707|nr:hypothetical protein [Ketobacter sp.]RLT95969.1 MAG: hypothetical protein D9N14_13825 [Ketobacter sp.]
MMMLAVMVYALSACGGGGSGSSADRNANQIAINGQVAIARSDSTFYSMEGADFAIYGLDKDLVLRGKQQVALGNGKVEQDGTLRLAVPSSAVRDSRLYVVEITCPPTPPATTCAVEAPIHVMLSGRQLQQGNWTASALTEIVYQNLAYYVAAEYSADQLANIMNSMASWLFNQSPSKRITYQDLLRWHPDRSAEYPPTARSLLLEQVLDNLISGFDVKENRRLSVQYIQPMVASADPGGWFFDIEIQDHLAFIADTRFGLRVYDISQSEELQEIGSLSMNSTGRDIALYGDYAFVSARDRLHIVDITVPQAPRILNTLKLTDVHSISITGQNLIVSDGVNGVLIYSIINPDNPFIFRSYPASLEAHKAVLDGNILYALFINTEIPSPESKPDKLLVVDISQSDSNDIYFGDIDGRHLTLLPEHLYVTSPRGITVFDRSRPDTLVQVGHLELDFAITNAVLGDDEIYLLQHGGDIQVVDIKQLANPSLLTRISTPTLTYSAAIKEQRLFVAAGPSGLLSMELDKLADPISRPIISENRFVRSTWANNDRLFSHELDYGIEVLDISRPSTPKHSAKYEDPERHISGITPHNGIAYLTLYGNGVQALDFSDPTAPTLLAEYDVGAQAYSILIDGNVAYIDFEDQGLHVVDISDPAQMMTIGRMESIGQILRSTKIGDYLYSALGPGGLAIIDVNNPTDPQLIAVTDDLGQVLSVARLGDFAYVATRDSGIHVLDVSSPAEPSLATTIDLEDPAYHIIFNGRYAYIANHSSGVTVMDVSTPSAPEILGTAPTSSYALHLTAHGNNLYVSTSRGVERLSLIKQ